MPNLEILDLSKNNITAFPEDPDQLINLKVLSLTHNGIYALPTYLTTFVNLKVFKVANNPIGWPVSIILLVSDDD
jgi:Leucine-rich repeat (LRR) protein